MISTLGLPKNTLTTKILGELYSNEKLKFVWEKLDRVVEKKLKKILLKITLENSPFDMEVFALKQVEKNI